MEMRKSNRTFGALCLATLAGLSLAIAGGTSYAAAGSSQGASQVSGARVDKDEYSLELKAPASCKAGSECKAEIVLKAKGEFHVNDKYPIKFKAPEAPPEGVAFTKSVVKKEDGKFAEREGTLPIAFTVSRAGKATISGTFSFGLCRDTECLMEKVELSVDVDVK